MQKDETGFDVVVEAETYGLYPFAGDWHGPPWEMTETSEVLCKEFMGFILALLCEDSMFEVRYAGKKPYEWILTYPTGNGLHSFETGGFPFNFFGEKSTRPYKNCHLPARYKPTKEVE